MKFWIISDVCCDLPQNYISQKDRFLVLSMRYEMNGEEHIYSSKDADTLDIFYKKISDGQSAKTSQINAEEYYQAFKPICESGEGLICLPLSSGISGSIQSANIAKKRILEEYPDAAIEVVDSLGATVGQGLLLDHVLQYRDSGKGFWETVAFAKETAPKIEHWFTLNDLQHLYRGGRLTKTAAFMGTLLKIQPLLHVDTEGKLAPQAKIKGRKKAIKELCNKLEMRMAKTPQKVFVSHSSCPDEALILKEMIEKLPYVSEVMIAPIGCIIGAHTGPGTLTVMFLGEKRN